jgi:integrase
VFCDFDNRILPAQGHFSLLQHAQRKITLNSGGWTDLRAHLACLPAAGEHDLRDLVDVLSGLGCRIGELLALDWPRVDGEAETIAIEGTVIRVPAHGLIVQPHTKSDAGMRTIRPPTWVIDLLRKRHADSHGPWVFPSTRRLDCAGLSAREIADYLGHERVTMTQDVYMSRKATSVNASAALDAFGPESVG